MTPDRILTDLAGRYDVPEGFGQRFVPLLQRALEAGPDVRSRILELVERSFVRESERVGRLRAEAERRQSPEWKLVVTVARIVHNWSPPEWLIHWGGPADEEPRPSA